MRLLVHSGLAVASMGACAQVVGADFDDYRLEASSTNSAGGMDAATNSTSAMGGLGGHSLCGNDMLDPGELCDGDCPDECVDGNRCTTDQILGSAKTCDAECSFLPAGCGETDGCCPANCFDFQDPDCPTPEPDDVLVLGNGSPSLIAALRAQLEATGRFATVSSMDALDTTVTTATLAPHDAVLVFSNASLWADDVGVGNALADYHDGGGRVVVALAAHCGEFGFAGRFITDGYHALGGVGVLNEAGGVGLHAIHEGASYLFDGVSTATVSTDVLCNAMPTSGAISLGEWDAAGGPVVAFARKEVGGRQRVDVNFFPDASNAGLIRLLGNALYFE